MTSGQNVPDDIEVFDTQKIVKQLLGTDNTWIGQRSLEVL